VRQGLLRLQLGVGGGLARASQSDQHAPGRHPLVARRWTGDDSAVGLITAALPPPGLTNSKVDSQSPDIRDARLHDPVLS
jgi:hypothetical protein